MGKKVFANGREISCKAGAGKSIAAFPDVCLSPPSPPAGPVPVPYPVTAQSSDTTGGSKHVKIDGQEIMLKDQSSFKKCTGDEAATKSLGMGVVTHNITGPAYFNSWSMDVKIEGQNAVRHLDLMTHNHACKPGQTPPWPETEGMAGGGSGDPCAGEKQAETDNCPAGASPCRKKKAPPRNPFAGELRAIVDKEARSKERARLSRTKKWKDWKAKRDKHYHDEATKNSQDPCLSARRCKLTPYGDKACCPGQTGHHLVEASAFHDKGRGGSGSSTIKGCEQYDMNDAPCICVEGTDHGTGTHGLMHTFQSFNANQCKPGALETSKGKAIVDKKGQPLKATTLGQAQKQAGEAVEQTFPECGCTAACIEAQLAAYHEKKCKMGKDQKIKAVSTSSDPDVDAAAAKAQERLAAVNKSRVSQAPTNE